MPVRVCSKCQGYGTGDWCETCTPSEQRTFSTGSIRDTATGKGRWDLLPYYGLMRWAARLEYGAEHYGDRNWEKGQPVSVLLDSAIRHAFKYLAGWTDEDHLGAALWNIGAAAEMEGRVEAGDLPKELLDLPRHDVPSPEDD